MLDIHCTLIIENICAVNWDTQVCVMKCCILVMIYCILFMKCCISVMKYWIRVIKCTSLCHEILKTGHEIVKKVTFNVSFEFLKYWSFGHEKAWNPGSWISSNSVMEYVHCVTRTKVYKSTSNLFKTRYSRDETTHFHFQ